MEEVWRRDQQGRRPWGYGLGAGQKQSGRLMTRRQNSQAELLRRTAQRQESQWAGHLGWMARRQDRQTGGAAREPDQRDETGTVGVGEGRNKGRTALVGGDEGRNPLEFQQEADSKGRIYMDAKQWGNNEGKSPQGAEQGTRIQRKVASDRRLRLADRWS